ncbi:MAG: GGDEF domain-containing protein, partial [Deltaproteobacteria bacterium]|nr:GGDEF domain-containing protein [Deltaproteobacteria bacterium]
MGWQRLISVETDRGAFVAYFLGAVVPLGIMGFALGRYTTLHAGPLGGDVGYAPLQPVHLLGLFAGISVLSLACFVLLRRLVRRAVEETSLLGKFDTVTGLPNRRFFQDRAEQARLRAVRDKGLFAVCFIDLDSFKAVNDRHGRKTGDDLL